MIARRIVHPLTTAEKNSKIEVEKQNLFLRILHKKIGTSHMHVGAEAASNRRENLESYEDDEDSSLSEPDLEFTIDPGKEVNQ